MGSYDEEFKVIWLEEEDKAYIHWPYQRWLLYKESIKQYTLASNFT